MGNTYSNYVKITSEMKKFVNAPQGAIIYGISKSRIMTLAQEAGAVYKIGASALINTEIFDKYLERYHESPRPLPKHMWTEGREKYKK